MSSTTTTDSNNNNNNNINNNNRDNNEDNDRRVEAIRSGYHVLNHEHEHLDYLRESLSSSSNTTPTTTTTTTTSRITATSSSSSSPSSWQVDSASCCPNLLGGGRRGHAMVVLETNANCTDHNGNYHSDDGNNNNKRNGTEVVLVLVGGYVQEPGGTPFMTDSTLILNVSSSNNSHHHHHHHQDEQTRRRRQWQQGPCLLDKRMELAVTQCQEYIYAIGGYNGRTELNTIERIHVSAFFTGSQWNHQTMSNTNNHRTTTSEREARRQQEREQQQKHDGAVVPPRDGWTLVPVRLQGKRFGCAAVTVQDRWLVVLGGNNGRHHLSSVEIIDTAIMASTTTASSSSSSIRAPVAVAVVWGPPLSGPRCWLSAAAVPLPPPHDPYGRRTTHIWVVGGQGSDFQELNTVECLEVSSRGCVGNNDHNNNLQGDSSTTNSFVEDELSFASSSSSSSRTWTFHCNLSLSTPRCGHSMTVLLLGGDHILLVVAGGRRELHWLSSVEVMDLRRGVVWSWPDLTVPRHEAALAVVPGRALPDPRILQLWVVGGWNGRHELETVECLSLVPLTWTNLILNNNNRNNSINNSTPRAATTRAPSQQDAEDAEEEEEQNTLEITRVKCLMHDKEEKFLDPNHQKTTVPNGQIRRRRQQVDRLCHTLLFYYLYQKQHGLNAATALLSRHNNQKRDQTTSFQKP